MYGHIDKMKSLEKKHKRIPKRQKKIHKKIYSQKEILICDQKEKIYVSHERFHSLEKNAKKKKNFDAFTSDRYQWI